MDEEQKTGTPNSYETNSVFQVDGRYQIIDPVGQGAYGIVMAARDRECTDPENEYVAIKKIERAFDHVVFIKRTLRELKIMRLLRHENVLAVKCIQQPVSRENFRDIYVISELMETDLSSIIKSPQPISDQHIQFFLYQLLRGLKYIHSAGVLHRDLKPTNLLVNSNCDLKICDLGLARFMHQEITSHTNMMTEYIATRWYRAPELILSWSNYSEAIDVWSVGCILAEMLLRKPMFPGKDVKHQLDLILETIGSPSEEEMKNIMHPESKSYLKSLPTKSPKDFTSIFEGDNPDAIQLIKDMLILDPAKRISIEGALESNYMKDLHYPSDEPT